MDRQRYISVIVPLKLDWNPCYSLPEGIELSDISVGDRVKVLFAGKEYSGVVCEIGINPETDLKKIRPILYIEKGLGRILPEEIELWQTVADYYMCSVGEVYKAAYPSGKISLEESRAAAIQKAAARKEKIAESIRLRIERTEARILRKKEQLAKARKESVRYNLGQEIEKAEKELEACRAALTDTTVSEKTKSVSTTDNSFKEIHLSSVQEKALKEINEGLTSGKPVLLYGVTGSGKTEIYMELAKESLLKGRNVLYLVPEIALSRQLEERLRESFGECLLTFHSGESAAERRNTAETIRQASSRTDNYILLGTRSSLFLPHNNLGLIIVDEEQDSSYKQDSPSPRYNGRDTALMLHQIHRCRIVLGSATPSLEEIYNCRTGKHYLVELKEKFHGSEEADIEIIDTRAERRKNGMIGNFSRKLIAHINRTLGNSGQVIILRSRRAWASAVQCDNCGEIVKCPHCNVSLSLHRNDRMICHYCGYSCTAGSHCSKCGGTLKNLGAGTQRIEEEAGKLFPNARIARLDSDTAQNKKFEAKTIREFSKGDIDILIGTQIVTKGFDFSNLSLVAVVSADSLLGLQDFRADEKAFQTLEQFRGRSGRRGKKGLLIIQTSQPEHPIYRKIAQKESLDFSSELFLERKEFHFPPFTRIIEICIKDKYEDRTVRMAENLSNELRKKIARNSEYDPVTGPYSPVIDKIADHYIKSIRICLKKDKMLTSYKRVITETVREFEKKHHYDGHISLNVDPS